MKTQRALTEEQVDKIIALLEEGNSGIHSSDLYPSIEERIYAQKSSFFINPKTLIMSLIVLLVAVNVFAVGTSIIKAKSDRASGNYSILKSEYNDDSAVEYVYNE